MKENLQKIILLVYKYSKARLKYKIRFVYFYTLFPLLGFLGFYLTGEFVKTVKFFNTEIPYLFFIIIGWSSNLIFSDAFLSTLRIFKPKSDIPLSTIIFSGRYIPIIALLLAYFLENTPLIFVYFLFASLIGYPLITFFAFLLLSLILILPGFALSLIFTILILPRRAEAKTITAIIERSLHSIFPIMFAAYVIPMNNILLYVLPNLGIVQEIRKILLLGTVSIENLLILIVISIVYLILGIFVYSRALEISRKKGWLKLV